jgi:hypothetical protein
MRFLITFETGNRYIKVTTDRDDADMWSEEIQLCMCEEIPLRIIQSCDGQLTIIPVSVLKDAVVTIKPVKETSEW